MKARVRIIGASLPPEGFAGQREVPVAFPGNSVGDLIGHLSLGLDSEGRKIFLDERGSVSPDLFVIVNGAAVSQSNRLGFPLNEGDLVEMVSAPG